MKGPSIRLGADVAEIGHKSLFMVRGFGITHLGNWTAERRKACSGMQTVVGARQYHQCNCIGFLRIGMSHVQTSVRATQHQCNCIGFPRNGMSVTCTVETVVGAGQWTAPVLHWLSFLPRDLWIAESQHIFTPFWSPPSWLIAEQQQIEGCRSIESPRQTMLLQLHLMNRVQFMYLQLFNR